jgi:hypothetical protein
MAINIGSDPDSAPGLHSVGISDTTFSMCSELGVDAGEGTLHHENGLFAIYQRLNFSASSVTGGGSAFHANANVDRIAAGGTWSFEFCTFLSCCGKAVIWSSTPATGVSMPSLEFCNFYHNAIVNPGAVLYGDRQGLRVISCHFGQLTPAGAKIIHRQNSSSDNSLKFRFENCVFANESPDTSFCTEMTGNTSMPTQLHWY